MESVISQQLAVKAAETIFLRVKKSVGGRVIPARIASLTESQMRDAGVSGAKIKAIQGLASAAISREISFNTLHEIDNDEEIFTQLTNLWGIGPWTVDMFMMFQLGQRWPEYSFVSHQKWSLG